MKRIFYLFLCMIPLLGFVSCDDDNDLPDVSFIVDITGDARYINDEIYIVAGGDFRIDGIKVVNNEEGKSATISYADFYWDYVYMGRSVVPPYAFDLELPEDIAVRDHHFEIYAPVYAVDKTMAFSVLHFVVHVVPSLEDLPEGGTTSINFKPHISETDPTE